MTDRLRHIADELDRLADVPTDLLAEVVTTGGACVQAMIGENPPEVTGRTDTDRRLAARLCGGCLVQRECLELELRWSGPHQVGVFGALPEDDRRALFPVWRARRAGGDRR